MQQPTHPALPVLRALAVGGVGGAIAAALDLPLAWMMGAMIASGIGASAGMRVHVPQNLRRVVLAVAGVYIGVEITPDLLARLGKLPVSLGMLGLYVVVITSGTVYALRKFLRTSWTTACCAALPGGLSAAIALSEGRGDDRLVALIHITRVASVVVAIPLIARASGDFGGASDAAAVWFWHWDYVRELTAGRGLLEVVLLAGFVAAIGILLNFKAPAFLLIAVVLSAAVRLAGWTQGQLPDFPLALAMLILGTAIGSGCHVMRGGGVLRLFATGLSIMLGVLALTVLFAYAGSAAMGIPFHLALLFFAPGGIAEMSLIAVALGADPPLVVLHQTLRILMILIIGPQLIAFAERIDRSAGRE